MKPCLKPGTLLIGHMGKTVAMIVGGGGRECDEYTSESGNGYLVTVCNGIGLGSFQTGSTHKIFIHNKGSGWKIIEGKR